MITFRLSPASEKKALSPNISLRKRQEDVSHPRKSPTRGKYHVIFNGFISIHYPLKHANYLRSSCRRVVQ